MCTGSITVQGNGGGPCHGLQETWMALRGSNVAPEWGLEEKDGHGQ